MKIAHYLSTSQKQILSQTQIQNLEILAMDSLDLNNFLQTEYMENPLFDYVPASPLYSDPFPRQSAASSDEDSYRPETADKTDHSLIDHITSQLNWKHYSPSEWDTILYLINCLDSNGFLSFSKEELLCDTHCNPQTFDRILSDLQELEPIGIFSFSLSQCLLKQLEQLGIQNSTLSSIILYHLQDVATGKISTISRSLSISTNQVKKYIAIIQSLNPRPLQGMAQEDASYITPDVILAYENNQWDVIVNDSWMGTYQLNLYYLNLMNKTQDLQLLEYFRQKEKRARYILSSIEQRHQTTLNIAKQILMYQKNYFLNTEPLRPMTLSMVAEQLNIHPSTVSRGIRGRYLQYPNGTVLMKSLFSPSVSKNVFDYSDLTSTEIKNRIQDIVKRENKQNPYSDQQILEKLQQEGITISRRAIAKYRNSLHIASSYERRENAPY